MDSIVDWLGEHEGLLPIAGLVSIVTFVGSLIVLPLLVSSLPADYFVSPHAPPTRWEKLHPLARVVLSTLKNVVGALVLCAGIAMLVLPGQGILTILAGLVLLRFPGKRRLEIWLVNRPGIHRGLDWIRVRAGRPPFEPPPSEVREAGS